MTLQIGNKADSLRTANRPAPFPIISAILEAGAHTERSNYLLIRDQKCYFLSRKELFGGRLDELPAQSGDIVLVLDVYDYSAYIKTAGVKVIRGDRVFQELRRE